MLCLFHFVSGLAKSYIGYTSFYYYDFLLAPIGPCWNWIDFGLLVALGRRAQNEADHVGPCRILTYPRHSPPLTTDLTFLYQNSFSLLFTYHTFRLTG